MSYYVGQRITLTATFADANEVAFDPSSMEFRIQTPDGATTPFDEVHADVTHPAVGTYKLSYLIEQAGRHKVVVESDADGQETVEASTFMAAATI